MSTRKKDSTGGCCKAMGGLLRPRFFKALGDSNRIALLCSLADSGRPRSVGELADCCPTDISVVSRHLAALRDAGVLQAHKRGREVFYTVCCEEFVGTLRAIADAIEACCPAKEKGGPGSGARSARSSARTRKSPGRRAAARGRREL